MDPISQGAVGALAAQLHCRGEQLAKGAFIGAAAGMAPDLDILIRSTTDPLLALEYHRHFTHALVFIPFGALLCSVFFYALLGRIWQLPFKVFYIWSLLGFATHALLDGCTSYGTQLLWPFVDWRISWDIVSVVDPLFTLPCLALIAVGIKLRCRHYTYAAIVWCGVYLSLGFVQHQRAIGMAETLAQQRGHNPLRVEVKPSFANILIWKTLYETEHAFFIDAVRVGLGTDGIKIWQGDSAQKLDPERDFPWLQEGSQQAQDIERFTWFSNGYVAVDKYNPQQIIDVRYSLLPYQIKPLWGIELDPNADMHTHVSYFSAREDAKAASIALWLMIKNDA